MTFRLWSWMLLLALFVPAFARAEEASADSSMPQLDPTYYMSQLFWLILCGATLYWLMDKVALPRVSRMVDLRDDQVRRDLELAYKLKQQAEDVKVDYTRALRDADYIYVKNWSAYRDYGAMPAVKGDWPLTKDKLLLTDNAQVMHCLPVRRNVELPDEIIDGPHSLIQQQAGNRVIAAQTVLKKMLEGI